MSTIDTTEARWQRHSTWVPRQAKLYSSQRIALAKSYAIRYYIQILHIHIYSHENCMNHVLYSPCRICRLSKSIRKLGAYRAGETNIKPRATMYANLNHCLCHECRPALDIADDLVHACTLTHGSGSQIEPLLSRSCRSIVAV